MEIDLISNDPENNFPVILLSLRNEDLKEIMSNKCELFLTQVGSNNFQFEAKGKKINREIHYKANSETTFDLYKLSIINMKYQQIGNIVTKLNPTIRNVTKNDYKRLERQTRKKNFRPKKMKILGREDDSDEQEENEEDEEDEIRIEVPKVKTQKKIHTESDADKEILEFLEELKITSIATQDIKNCEEYSKKIPEVVIKKKIESMEKYYEIREKYYQKYVLYQKINRLLNENASLFQKLFNYYELSSSYQTKKRVKEAIEQLNNKREKEVKEMLRAFQVFHKELGEKRESIEKFVKEKKNR